MHPIIFQNQYFTIYSYGLMLALATMVGIFFTAREYKKKHSSASPLLVYDFGFWTIIGGIVGARLLFVILDFSYFKNNPLEIIMLNHGGLVYYGGLIGGIISGYVFLKIKRIFIQDMVLCLIPFMPLGHAIGRAGCFLNGCCYGKFDSHGNRYPTQIYEIIFNLLIFVILMNIKKKCTDAWQMVFSYLFLYGLGRFVVEFFRGDDVTVFSGLRISQWISLFFMFISIIYFLKVLLKKKKEKYGKK